MKEKDLQAKVYSSTDRALDEVKSADELLYYIESFKGRNDNKILYTKESLKEEGHGEYLRELEKRKLVKVVKRVEEGFETIEVCLVKKV